MPPADRWPHGTRARYISGKCRCADCRKANTAYQKYRDAAKKRGESNPLVLAGRAQAHLLWLQEHQIGRRTVKKVSGVAVSVIQKIVRGQKRQIRRSTEQKLLSVTLEHAGGNTLVPADKTWERIKALQNAGWPKARIAKALGYAVGALQLRKTRVTRKSADAVRDILRRHYAKTHRLP